MTHVAVFILYALRVAVLRALSTLVFKCYALREYSNAYNVITLVVSQYSNNVGRAYKST